MIDLHHHLLFGMDDGPATQRQMEQMLLRASEDGVTVVVATPHYLPGIFPFPAETYALRIRQANEATAAMGLALQVLGGAEMLYTPQAERHLAERRVPTLAGSTKVLVEFQPSVRLRELMQGLETILRGGYLPVLAHVERYGCLMAGRGDAAARLKRELEVTLQMNADTVAHGGRLGQRAAVRALLERGLVDHIASDAHNTDERGCRMGAAYRAVLGKLGLAEAERMFGTRESMAEFLDR